ncbi:MAG TPA: nucleotidyltransferase domain-containing protein [Candidatus Saccharimonadales bacterium]
MRATTYDEVVSGRLNHPERRYQQAAQLAYSALSAHETKRHLIGAVLFGSAIAHDLFTPPEANPLSDLDLIVISKDDGTPKVTDALREMSEQIFDKTAVSTEVTWLTEPEAIAGHTLTTPMLAWLRRRTSRHPDTVIGENPADIIEPLEIDHRSLIEAWISRTTHNLKKSYVSNRSETLSMALSIPHITARKSLDALQFIRYRYESLTAPTVKIPSSFEVSRDGVTRAVHDIYGAHNPSISELYTTVAGAKSNYIAFLMEEVACHKVSKAEYERAIQNMTRDIAPKSLDLLGGMQDAFLDISEVYRHPTAFASPNSAQLSSLTERLAGYTLVVDGYRSSGWSSAF